MKVEKDGNEAGANAGVIVVREGAIDGRKIGEYRILRIGRLEGMSTGVNITYKANTRLGKRSIPAGSRARRR